MESPPTRPPDSLEEITPADCALAVGVPLTETDFVARRARPDSWDFAANYERGRNPQSAWKKYEPEAKAMRRQCDEIAAMGAAVKCCATLADFSALFADFKVVALLTHWPLLSLAPEDIKDLEAIRAALLTPTHPIHEHLRRALAARAGGAAQPVTDGNSGEEESLPKQLVAIVEEENRRYAMPLAKRTPLARFLAWFFPKFSQVSLKGHIHTGPFLSRAVLEGAFQKEIVPGPTIEFADGMHTLPDFLEAIPPKFSGVLHMAVCHSVLPAQPVKERCGRCLVTMNRFETPLVVRLLEMKLLVACLARKRMPYLKAIERTHVGLKSF